MKKVKYLCLCLIMGLVMVVSGCETGTIQPGDQNNGKQLSTPTNLRIVEYGDLHILFFDEVEDAKEYDIRIYRKDETTVLAIGQILLSDFLEGYTLEKLNRNESFSTGVYEVAVRALADKDSKDIDSKFSERIAFTIVNGDVDNQCVVTFDTDGGSSVSPQVITKGECAKKPVNPTKEGYEFVSWMNNGLIFDFTTPILENTELVAFWKEKQQQSIVDLTTYYKSLLDASGTLPAGNALKLKLREIISKGALSTTYDQLKSSTKGLGFTDADPEKPGNIILFYSQQSISAKWDGGNTWNREHVVPKSIGWGYYESGPGSDIHHIRPTDSRVNSTRSNLKVGNVVGGKEVKYNGLVVAHYNSNYFEPLDSVKGDVARIYLYMITRYSEADNWNVTRAAQSLELLLEWNRLDPVSDFERLRNERSYQVQKNRNPFIDYPEFVDMIWA